MLVFVILMLSVIIPLEAFFAPAIWAIAVMASLVLVS